MSYALLFISHNFSPALSTLKGK